MIADAIDALEYHDVMDGGYFTNKSAMSCLAGKYKFSRLDAHAALNEASFIWLKRKSKTNQYARSSLTIFITDATQASLGWMTVDHIAETITIPS